MEFYAFIRVNRRPKLTPDRRPKLTPLKSRDRRCAAPYGGAEPVSAGRGG